MKYKKTKATLAVATAAAVGAYAVGERKVKSFVGETIKSKRYVMYDPKDLKNMVILDEKPITKSDDNLKVVEDRVYTLNFSSCAPDPDAIDPDPTKAVIPWGIDRIEAVPAQSIESAKSIVVCVADTGVDIHHPDIKNMIVGGESYVSGEANFDDDSGHGTHVAGTIAAQANDRDVVGASQSRILVSKVLDRWGSGYGSWISRGIIGCVDKGARVINLSLGSARSHGPDPLIRDAIGYALSKNVVVVAAAGNDSGEVGYPAALPGVIAVSALDRNNKLARFSSRGPEIKYSAPGEDILSLSMGGGVETMSGTSMATPHVAGVIALALATGNPVSVINLGLHPDHQGLGMVHALKTVKGE